VQTIRATRTIGAPIEEVFDLFADHASYDRFPGLRSSELVAEGEPKPNGLGALRRIAAPPVRFLEEITRFERPTRIDYLIREINLPLRHEGGTMSFERTGAGTRVEWRSTFEVGPPVIGPILGRSAGPLIRRGFDRILADADRRLTSSS
jgi:uncharacterized protein YndB with AHSA1/START domain